MLTSDGTKGVAFHLLFAGRETHKLSDTVARLDLEDCTTLLPYRRDPERLLKISSIAVNASTANESFSGALLNAQAMGLPAVTSDVGGNTEAIEDGITGFVVPPGDAAALAQALERLLTLPADRLSLMKQRSRQRALDLFSSETRTRNRLQTYHAALAHRA
jgi:glycosyltransferase involved in cell wall biosynthesis